MQYLFSALQDSVSPLQKLSAGREDDALTSAFEGEIGGMLRDIILDPLCKDIEMDLRLHAHSHLQLDERNPFRQQGSKLQDLSPFLQA